MIDEITKEAEEEATAVESVAEAAEGEISKETAKVSMKRSLSNKMCIQAHCIDAVGFHYHPW